MKLGQFIGRVAFYRGKGNVWLDAARPWILPIFGGGVALKYLGLSSRWAITTMIGVALASEVMAVLLGWLERRSGATAANYELAKVTDPYKLESLKLLQEIRDRVGKA